NRYPVYSCASTFWLTAGWRRGFANALITQAKEKQPAV
ncbi:hypothetical protein PSYJA_45391, partial [Pseudomonas syringae pv. japonica str. M301072]